MKEVLCRSYQNTKNGKAMVWELNGTMHTVTVKDFNMDGDDFRIEAPRAVYCSTKFYHFGEFLDMIMPDRPFPDYWASLGDSRYPSNEIGYCRAYLDSYRWNSRWFPIHDTSSIDPSEIDAIYNDVYDNIPNMAVLREFCRTHCVSCNGKSEDELNGFIEGKDFDYYIRFILRRGDYNMYMHVLRKEREDEV